MFKTTLINIFNSTIDAWKALNIKGKLIVILAIAILILIGTASILTRNIRVGESAVEANTLAGLRDEIDKLGNPFNIPKKNILNQYPQIINQRVDQGLSKSIYVIDVNTTMLTGSKYNDLFTSAESIKSSLQSKPLFYTDQYQMFYDLETNQPVNPFSRMSNFHEIELNGKKKWFSEENQDYWVTDPSVDPSDLNKVVRNMDSLPGFQNLQKVGPAKFLVANKNADRNQVDYTSIEIFGDYTSRIKQGYQDYSFITPPPVNDDPKFIGGISPSDSLPETFVISPKYTINRSALNSESVFTFTDISDVNLPARVTGKDFKIKESNSLFISCSYDEQKCWIFNPGLNTIKIIDRDLNIKDQTSSKSLELIKIKTAIEEVYDKNRIMRYNEQSKELLFFYEGKWTSILRD